MANAETRTEPRGPQADGERAKRIESDVIVESRHIADRAAHALRRPAVGAAAFGAAVLAAGAIWGASEAALAAVAAYAAYRVLRRRAEKRTRGASDGQAARSSDRPRT